ncbi:MAG: hypothetical protein H6R02_2852 [Burkholderiaceae bacterium]|nr:hypothetical protein [Burkholderiaceae bacterium]
MHKTLWLTSAAVLGLLALAGLAVGSDERGGWWGARGSEEGSSIRRRTPRFDATWRTMRRTVPASGAPPPSPARLPRRRPRCASRTRPTSVTNITSCHNA